MEEQKVIITDTKGNQILDIFIIPEEQMPSIATPLTNSLVVVKVGIGYLVGFNNYRKVWEIFGGCIEMGETPRQCAMRELKEETGIEEENLTYIGLVKYFLKPDYFSPEERIEYGALYGVTLSLNPDQINNLIGKDQDEINDIRLYYPGTDIGEFDLINKKLLEYWRD